ncbi:MAG: thioredoxin family protein [Actinomycetota bacterium]|nr:thioredoxin family protein [Actinomycetota bacterium]MEC9058888.1 thioredoxin family protein [Actinomycetota bacterium]MEC9473752.1 thioredoxin family protein [Actinomycetota bacterium]
MPSDKSNPSRPHLQDGLIAVVKRDCPTCLDIVPVLEELSQRGPGITVYTQDDADFPASIDTRIDDRSLEFSWHHNVETVPTLMYVQDGAELARTVGWSRRDWEAMSGVDDLGTQLPEMRPGCGSLSVDPNLADALDSKFGQRMTRSRTVEFANLEDEFDAMFDRGWSDGLPIIPPTEERVARMLSGTARPPDEIVAIVPPTLNECSVEKVAINAVMAGCKPEYLPVVLAAVEAACTDQFNMHGLLCTLWFSGPIVIVNGPIRRQIGMNTDKNALGQGNRANSTIGRALQLVVRNVGGGKPGIGGIDRSALGSPSKVGWCFAEDEENLPEGWDPLSVTRGFERNENTVTLFAGHGPIGCIDQISRTPESLIRTLAQQLQGVGNRKLPSEAMIVMTPEHMNVFAAAGWSKRKFYEELEPLLQMDPDLSARGASGIEEGIPVSSNEETVFGSVAGREIRKLPEWSPMVVRAGGGAGGFSAILEGWVPGSKGSTPITHRIGV